MRDLKPHGTNAAIMRHRRASEPLCEECRVERNRLARAYYHSKNPNTTSKENDQ